MSIVSLIKKMSINKRNTKRHTVKETDERRFDEEEKEKRAAELVLANIELAFQNEQKEKRAQELIIANKELAYQTDQKEKRAQELIIANKELAYQNDQKEKRAQELIVANKELAYQNEQKEKRASELIIANEELAYQNEQKEKRAEELIIANKELAYQNEQKEKRAQELAAAINDLEAFAYISSHHLQEPLRKIQLFVDRILERESSLISPKGRNDLNRIDVATNRMRKLIQEIYTFSRINVSEQVFAKVNIALYLKDVIEDFERRANRDEKFITLSASEEELMIIPLQFQLAIDHLFDNALKFAVPGLPAKIVVSGKAVPGTELKLQGISPSTRYYLIEVKDNGIGFHHKYSEQIFELFEKLHTVDEYPGTGAGLAIVKKIMHWHKGFVTVSSVPGEGSSFHLYFPLEGI
jgi:signal transduction histidine kinase